MRAPSPWGDDVWTGHPNPTLGGPARPHKVITHQLADLRAFDEIMAEAAGRCARCRRSAQTVDEDGLHYLRS